MKDIVSKNIILAAKNNFRFIKFFGYFFILLLSYG